MDINPFWTKLMNTPNWIAPWIINDFEHQGQIIVAVIGYNFVINWHLDKRTLLTKTVADNLLSLKYDIDFHMTFTFSIENWVLLKPVSGAWEMLHFSLSLKNRLNKTRSAVFSSSGGSTFHQNFYHQGQIIEFNF